MNKYALARIIGNELPPRDSTGNRVESLKFILKNEPDFTNCSKIWIINQIESTEVKESILNLLSPYHVEIMELDRKKFLRQKTFDGKVIEAININKARNRCLDVAKGHKFTFVFDGDCFFTQELWDQTIGEIEIDQNTNVDRKYYGVPAARIVSEIPSDLTNYHMWEPSMIFRDDAELRFNENIPFSKGEKLELMKKIGYKSKDGITTLEGDMCKNVGCLLHISFNEPTTETNLHYRMSLRDKSIELFLTYLENKYARRMYQ